MEQFAEFKPISLNNKEEMLDYYNTYNIALPDNTYFRNYFNITEQDIPSIEGTKSIDKPKKWDLSNISIPEVSKPKQVFNDYELTPEILRPMSEVSNKIIDEIKGLSISDEDKDYLIKLAAKESSYRPDVTNRLGYYGLYQFGNIALKDIGKTKEQFKDTLVQHQGALELARLNERRLKDIIEEFSGKTVDGIKITKNGIRAAAHLLGAGTVKDYFLGTRNSPLAKQGFRDANKTHITEYLKMYPA